MRRRFVSVAALLGVLAVACGKYGPPVRTHEPAGAPSAATAEAPASGEVSKAEDESGSEEGSESKSGAAPEPN